MVVLYLGKFYCNKQKNQGIFQSLLYYKVRSFATSQSPYCRALARIPTQTKVGDKVNSRTDQLSHHPSITSKYHSHILLYLGRQYCNQQTFRLYCIQGDSIVTSKHYGHIVLRYCSTVTSQDYVCTESGRILL